jgi:prepilin-type N-terminal cleavage/methylation domain-containing protein
MRRRGFTLIELMIVAAILGILAMIALPKFASMVQKSKDAALVGHLGALRSALSIYIADNEGIIPSQGPYFCLVPRYIDSWPRTNIPPHHTDGEPMYIAAFPMNGYNGEPFGMAVNLWYPWRLGSVGSVASIAEQTLNTSRGVTNIGIMCTHTDSRGRMWSTY